MALELVEVAHAGLLGVDAPSWAQGRGSRSGVGEGAGHPRDDGGHQLRRRRELQVGIKTKAGVGNLYKTESHCSGPKMRNQDEAGGFNLYKNHYPFCMEMILAWSLIRDLIG